MSTKLNLKSLTKSKKIESPLAKYNSVGQLFCVLCNSQVKNEIYWTGHVNGKAHKENLAQLKLSQSPGQGQSQGQERDREQQQQQQGNKGGGTFVGGVKRPASASKDDGEGDRDEGLFKEPFPKRMMVAVGGGSGGDDKVITRGGGGSGGSSSNGEDSQRARNIRAAEEELSSMMVDEEVGGRQNMTGAGGGSDNGGNQDQDGGGEEGSPAAAAAAPLPAGFFDDPKEDAKARGVKFKDPQDAEWEKFVKEIATEDLKSNELVGLDQEATAVDRELEQIEEQMVQWQRVIQLEKKAEQLGKLKSADSQVNRTTDQGHHHPDPPGKKGAAADDNKMEEGDEDDDDEDEDLDYDEELDWRNKKR